MYGKGANRMSKNGTILVTAKSLGLVNDPLILNEVGKFENQKRPKGLVENLVHFYGFEISPINAADELSLRAIMLVDPQIPVIPDSLINFGAK